MIDYLQGTVSHCLPDRLIVLAGGVGYGVEVALPLLCKKFRDDEVIKLWIYTHIRPESMRLFGFQSLAEKQTFATLLSVSGIGPRIALAILSSMTVSELLQIIQNNQPTALKSVPGIGARTAEKIIVELKNKTEHILNHLRTGASIDGASQDQIDFSKLAKPSDNQILIHDVKSALVNLGFKEQEFAGILSQVESQITAPTDFQTLLKNVLSSLNSSKQKRNPSQRSADQNTLEDLF